MEIIQRQGMPSMMSTMFDAKKEFAKTDADGDMQISMDENMKKFNKTDSDSKTTVHNCYFIIVMSTQLHIRNCFA